MFTLAHIGKTVYCEFWNQRNRQILGKRVNTSQRRGCKQFCLKNISIRLIVVFGITGKRIDAISKIPRITNNRVIQTGGIVFKDNLTATSVDSGKLDFHLNRSQLGAHLDGTAIGTRVLHRTAIGNTIEQSSTRDRHHRGILRVEVNHPIIGTRPLISIEAIGRRNRRVFLSTVFRDEFEFTGFSPKIAISIVCAGMVISATQAVMVHNFDCHLLSDVGTEVDSSRRPILIPIVNRLIGTYRRSSTLRILRQVRTGIVRNSLKLCAR